MYYRIWEVMKLRERMTNSVCASLAGLLNVAEAQKQNGWQK